jgi:hypothetical protein
MDITTKEVENIIQHTDTLKLSLGDIIRNNRNLKIESYNKMIVLMNKLKSIKKFKNESSTNKIQESNKKNKKELSKNSLRL